MKNLKPFILFSDTFLTLISPFMRIRGISLFPFVIIRERYKDANSVYINNQKRKLLNHETIHFQQQLEMLILPFYIWYVVEFILKTLWTGKSGYRQLSFEREANEHERDSNYIPQRKRYSWLKYL